MSSDDVQTLTSQELYASQAQLIDEAAEALPHQFTSCTYPLGPLRQAVYLCLTCKLNDPDVQPKGICSACSVACHTDHEQLELFPKRDFRCDCPTTQAHRCTLYTALEPSNEGNKYGQNFRGLFCRCGRPYDAKKERETMIQCVGCEDWFHESCLNLRERPASRALSPVKQEDGDASDEEGSLPPPLISGEDYDALVCGSCVLEIPTLKRYAGTTGVMMVVRHSDAEPWKVIGQEEDGSAETNVEIDAKTAEAEGQTGSKRPREEGSADGSNKRLRGSPSAASESKPCLAPTPNPTAQKIYKCTSANGTDEGKKPSPSEPNFGTGDVFLTEGWRARWCKCPSCLPSLESRPYLLEEEDTYEPPEDPDSGLSLEELGMRALSRLPRERALDGIRAFNAMRDGLMDYLRPFAMEGRVVQEADVRAFFEAKKTENGEA
ncbi:hypothetical protein NEOLEDRAFT_1132888 [Neolentinus lepideus HHB14362 ss-1]|uniref:UBR-type domain-containing protein n=1 Tax=Neolentinus lepideus HHB14362 ss-1 TaxID=1314782 RepID=A0A165SZ09_9AGAM|nr:hypothetical protein NEOLEDRAFT_1132888 [Neolentinus lepideus HHB14362 ss-1]